MNLNDQPSPPAPIASPPTPPPPAPTPVMSSDDDYAADDEPEYESIESEIQLRPTIVFDNPANNADGVWIEEAATLLDAPSFGFAIGSNGADVGFARTLALGGLQSVEGSDTWPPPADATLVGLLVEYKSNVKFTKDKTFELSDDPLKSGLQITANQMMRPLADANGIATEACYGRSLVGWSRRVDNGVGSIGALRSMQFNGLTAVRWVYKNLKFQLSIDLYFDLKMYMLLETSIDNE